MSKKNNAFGILRKDLHLNNFFRPSNQSTNFSQPVPSDFIEKEPLSSVSSTNKYTQQCPNTDPCGSGRPIQTSSSIHLTGSSLNMHLTPGGGGHTRRESFLYKTDPPEALTCRPVSRASSVTSTEHPHPAPL